MNIGSKIKQARNDSGLTQERAAELIGVSRQTVSNWENEKSYPDIVSVIKMSDIYNVSLDRLLKEDSNMNGNGYIDYLEDSTNVVKSRNRLSKIILLGVFLLIWAAAQIVFWFTAEPTRAGGVAVLSLWILLSVTAFVISLLSAKMNLFGKIKWALPVFFGFMFMLVPFSAFGFSGAQAVHTFRWPDFLMLPVGALISLAGTAIGALISKKTR